MAARRGQLQPYPDVPDFGVYAVAFSFAGEQADLVRRLAQAVEDRLLWGEVFFDEMFAHKIQDSNTPSLLPDVYGNRCVVAVRCLSDEYRQKHWTSLENGAITARQVKHPDSALDVLVTPCPTIPEITGCNVNAASNFSDAVAVILQRLNVRQQSGAQLDVAYGRITCAEANLLAGQLSPLVVPGALRRAVSSLRKDFGIAWPVEERPDHAKLIWWINKCRQHDDCRALDQLLIALWPSVKPRAAFIQHWYADYLLRQFQPPVPDSKVIQIRRDPCLGSLKGESKISLTVDVVDLTSKNRERLDSLGEISLEQLGATCARCLDVATTRAQSSPAKTRVEFIVNNEHLAGDMQRLPCDEAGTPSTVGLAYPTVMRSVRRTKYPVDGATWAEIATRPLDHFEPDGAFVNLHLAAGKAIRLPQTTSIEPRQWSKLIAACAPIAFGCACGGVLSDADLAQLRCDRDEFPARAWELRQKNGSDLVVLFEDPSIPIPEFQLLDNAGLELP